MKLASLRKSSGVCCVLSSLACSLVLVISGRCHLVSAIKYAVDIQPSERKINKKSVSQNLSIQLNSELYDLKSSPSSVHVAPLTVVRRFPIIASKIPQHDATSTAFGSYDCPVWLFGHIRRWCFSLFVQPFFSSVLSISATPASYHPASCSWPSH